MEWDNGVTIGYSAAGDPYENHDPSSSDVACVNSPNSDWNNVLYLISGESPEEAIPREYTQYVYMYFENGEYMEDFVQL